MPTRTLFCRCFCRLLLLCLTPLWAMPVLADSIRNAQGKSVAAIETNGTVRNDRNNVIGRASGVNPYWAAAYFFFNFF